MSAMSDLDIMLSEYEEARAVLNRGSGSSILLSHLQAVEKVVRKADILVAGLRSMLVASGAREPDPGPHLGSIYEHAPFVPREPGGGGAGGFSTHRGGV